jgi:hypothetical protein
MSAMFGIDSRALSGRRNLPRAVTQGIVRMHSALGWVLVAFQATPMGSGRPSMMLEYLR